MTLKKLGRYEVLGELGKGAMGVVFLAHDPVIGRQVALKTLRLGPSIRNRDSQQFRERFKREAQSAGILNHPNIVTIYDVLEDEGGIFIAMEYVKGTDLKQLMRRYGALEPEFVIDLVSQIADGLDYAHQKGVIHRDIKPANIILTAEKQAKITDFGIARLDTSDLTMDGQMLGTPNYMAPEQILGRDVDHRADLFSLGVMLYEMLTGHKPFHGDNLTVVTHRIVHDAFTPPEQFQVSLPESFLPVLGQALAKEPEDRFSRGAELARALRALSAEPPPADTLSMTASTVSRSFLSEVEAPAPPPPPPPEAAAEQSAAAKPGFLSSAWSRLILVAGASLLVLAVLISQILKPSQPSDGAPPVSQQLDPQLEEERRYLENIRAGRLALDAGDPAAAREAFEAALAIRPGDPEIERLRDRAESELLEDPEDESFEEVYVGRRLAATLDAMERRDYRNAIDLADKVLAVDPNHGQAQELKRQAEEGLARQQRARDRLTRRELPPPNTTTPPPPAAEPPPPRTVAQQVPLEIQFESQIAKGLLTVFQESRQVFQRSFDFDDKRRGKRGRTISGSLNDVVTVTAGPTTLRAYVSFRPNKRAERVTEMRVLETDLSPDLARTLLLEMSREGELTATLTE